VVDGDVNIPGFFVDWDINIPGFFVDGDFNIPGSFVDGDINIPGFFVDGDVNLPVAKMNNNSVLTIGTFDGLHLGHQKVLKKVVEIAIEEGLQSVVISYKDHPAFVLKMHPMPKMLCPAEIKQREMKKLGIERIELLDFTLELAKTPPLKFLKDFIIPRFHPKVIVMGYDSHFGHLRQGNLEFLCRHSEELGYRVEYVEPLLFEGEPISSSSIRDLLLSGKIEAANFLLGRPYRLIGNVGHSNSQGRKLGFPTANLNLLCPHQLVPKSGIYLSKVFLQENVFFGLTNIGCSPTVKKTGIIEIETHILDFQGDLYGQSMELELLRYLREEKMFKSVDELKEAIQNDIALAHIMLKEFSQ